MGYRLGVEGLLHLDAAPDNRGVLDWIAGLRWVRRSLPRCDIPVECGRVPPSVAETASPFEPS
ncbi:hypothetical protein [Streptomyces sp. 4F14]|uniref:hypothetical protein n=1 Tax=Streptomyces sp. 4F14 TaxID=3394380 RepID=UPI003A83F19F